MNLIHTQDKNLILVANILPAVTATPALISFPNLIVLHPLTYAPPAFYAMLPDTVSCNYATIGMRIYLQKCSTYTN
jgi:hypothetical protein